MMEPPFYKTGTMFPFHLLAAAVEGMRKQWREGMLSNYPRPNQPAPNRAYYLGALKTLAAQFAAPAFERALPVARFQHQLEEAIRMMERAVTLAWLVQNQEAEGYKVVSDTAEVRALKERHATLDFGAFVIKQREGDDGPEELYGLFDFHGGKDDTWAFRLL